MTNTVIVNNFSNDNGSITNIKTAFSNHGKLTNRILKFDKLYIRYYYYF